MGLCYEDDRGCSKHGKQTDILDLLEALQVAVAEPVEYLEYENDDYQILLPAGEEKR